MNFVTRPPIDANGVGHGPDDLDEALFAFFRSEMPDPWPELKLPARAPSAPPVRLPTAVPTPSRRRWFRSPRFALAASVAILIGGYAVMSSALAPPVAVENTKFDAADKRHTPVKMLEHSAPAPAAEDESKIKLRVDSLDQFPDGSGAINFHGERPTSRFKGR